MQLELNQLMMNGNYENELHSEILFQKWRNGFKQYTLGDISAPKNKLASSPMLLTRLMSHSFNVFLTNRSGEFIYINESTAETCGSDAPCSARGTMAIDYFDRENAFAIEQFNAETLIGKRNTLRDYDICRKDGVIKHVLTFRAPCYDSHGIVTGLLGCSIAVGEHDLSSSLSQIAEIGLTAPSGQTASEQQKPESFSLIDGIFFSSREMSCLRYVVRGKTSRDIAVVLGLSVRTVEHYIDNIKSKLGVSSKSEMIDRTLEYLDPLIFS